MPKNSIVWFTTIASWIPRLSVCSLWAVALALPVSAQVKEVEIVGTPQVYGDRVMLRVQTKGEGDRPIVTLAPNDFSIIVDGQPVTLADWKSPSEATPPPAWVVVLLDFSGSMLQPDSSGEAKLDGAIGAISKFRETLGDRAGDTQVSIVPFGVGGANNCSSREANAETLNRFSSVNDAKLEIFLENLLKLKPCASTDLYSPVIAAADFLTDPTDPRFNVPEDSNEPEPRLSIILLSDGFHNNGSITKTEAMDRLKQITSNHPELTIHTLGYGLSPVELQQKYVLSAPATISDVGKTVPAEEFVDQQTLKEIANLTGGIHEFSGNAAKIAADLQLFLDALLGEYEIDYIEPNPERGSKHTVQVVVNDSGSEAVSTPKPYITEVFGRSLPPSVRASLLALTLLVMGLAGGIPFLYWAKGLKKELE
ncbi:MAG: VWA domain-containing protein [Phormidesmis priestleyi]|uniref:VWA domain-containing protein n=1 Tax=Phormidesmis priestleyi TaxID=268141 RepID=A0A2W4WY74_9CYAN|nr:MAG: VWA domain-containing protein [Phormidesmis priestleyi]